MPHLNVSRCYQLSRAFPPNIYSHTATIIDGAFDHGYGLSVVLPNLDSARFGVLLHESQNPPRKDSFSSRSSQCYVARLSARLGQTSLGLAHRGHRSPTPQTRHADNRPCFNLLAIASASVCTDTSNPLPFSKVISNFGVEVRYGRVFRAAFQWCFSHGSCW